MMNYVFEHAADGTIIIVDIMDIGATDNPISLELYDHDSRVLLAVEGPGWHMVGQVLMQLEYETDGCDDEMQTHGPIVDLLSAIHYACVAEPDFMGVLDE